MAAERVLIDTQIFILGYSEIDNPAEQVLQTLRKRNDTILLMSAPLEDQIRRVARRVRNKDWAGLILSRIWEEFTVEYVILPAHPFTLVHEIFSDIPREDVLIFLTALLGRTTLLISDNREFIRASATQQQLFSCQTPEEFLAQIR